MTSSLSSAGSSSQWRRIRQAVIDEEPECYLCGAPSTTADHIVPRKVGGDDRRDNLRGCCEPCNLARGAGRWAEPSRDW